MITSKKASKIIGKSLMIGLIDIQYRNNLRYFRANVSSPTKPSSTGSALNDEWSINFLKTVLGF
jgi:hypothetical protein